MVVVIVVLLYMRLSVSPHLMVVIDITLVSDGDTHVTMTDSQPDLS